MEQLCLYVAGARKSGTARGSARKRTGRLISNSVVMCSIHEEMLQDGETGESWTVRSVDAAKQNK